MCHVHPPGKDFSFRKEIFKILTTIVTSNALKSNPPIYFHRNYSRHRIQLKPLDRVYVKLKKKQLYIRPFSYIFP